MAVSLDWRMWQLLSIDSFNGELTWPHHSLTWRQIYLSMHAEVYFIPLSAHSCRTTGLGGIDLCSSLDLLICAWMIYDPHEGERT